MAKKKRKKNILNKTTINKTTTSKSTTSKATLKKHHRDTMFRAYFKMVIVSKSIDEGKKGITKGMKGGARSEQQIA